VVEQNISQRDHFDEKIDALERHLITKIDAVARAATLANQVAERAIMKAEIATEKRLEGLNELRGVVSDYQRTLMPRVEANQRFDSIDAQIDKLEKAVSDQTAHKAGLASGWAYLIAAVGLLGGIAGIVIAVFG
jgi:hypothetical protein